MHKETIEGTVCSSDTILIYMFSPIRMMLSPKQSYSGRAVYNQHQYKKIV